MIVFTIGLPSSASTWVYNVARSILSANGMEHAAFIGETLGDFIHADIVGKSHAVVKSHRFEGGFHQVVQVGGMATILSVRDPRDATASLVQRFDSEAGVSAMQISRSMANICALADTCDHLTLQFEERFSDKKQSVADIADYLKLKISDDAAERIFQTYHAHTVKEFISTLAAAPDKRRDGDLLSDMYTQFHPRHITDQKIGKWGSFFEVPVAESLDAAFRDYAELIASGALGEKGGASRYMREAGFCVAFDTRLFAPVDSINDFTRALSGWELLHALGLKRLDHVHLPPGKWEMEFECCNSRPKAISICQDGRVVARSENESRLRFVHENRLSTHPFDLFVETEDMASDINAPPEGRLTARYLAAV